jgi:hypothetical protein
MEAGLYGVLGGVLGLAFGVPYAWLLIRIAVTDAPLRLPGGQLLVVFTALAIRTALAGLLPARRATRITPDDRTEQHRMTQGPSGPWVTEPERRQQWNPVVGAFDRRPGRRRRRVRLGAQ